MQGPKIEVDVMNLVVLNNKMLSKPLNNYNHRGINKLWWWEKSRDI